MSKKKKYIVLDGKKIEIKEEEVESTEEETPESEEEEEEEEETSEEETPTEKQIRKAAKKAAKDIFAELKGFDQIKALSEKVESLMERSYPNDAKLKQILNGKDYIKDIDNLTKEEKIVGFFHALVTRNESAIKALSEGTAADGGDLFPDEFREEMIKEMAQFNVMRGLVRVITMKRDVMKIPAQGSMPKVTWTEENAAKSTTTADWSLKTLTVKKCAAILYSSDELIEDSDIFDVVQLIISLFAEAVADEEQRVIILGNGTTQPTGLETARVDGTIITVAPAIAGAGTFDDILELEYALPSKYRKNGVYIANNQTIKSLRKLKDNDGRYLWAEPVAQGNPSTLGGKPVFEVSDLPNGTIYFGDFRRAYWLGDRKRMSVKVSQDTETAFTKDQTAIRVVHRIAGNVVQGNTLRVIQNM